MPLGTPLISWSWTHSWSCNNAVMNYSFIAHFLWVLQRGWSCRVLQWCKQLWLKRKMCQPWCTTLRRNMSPSPRSGPLRARWLSAACQYQVNALDSFSWWNAVLPSAAAGQGDFWLWGVSGCSSQPLHIIRAGVPRSSHPKSLLDDQAPWHPISAPTTCPLPIRSCSTSPVNIQWDRSNKMS